MKLRYLAEENYALNTLEVRHRYIHFPEILTTRPTLYYSSLVN